jgi:hypothetical protein
MPHGHVTLLEGRAKSLQHCVHTVAVLERPPHTVERRGVQHHVAVPTGRGTLAAAHQGHELPHVKRLHGALLHRRLRLTRVKEGYGFLALLRLGFQMCVVLVMVVLGKEESRLKREEQECENIDDHRT